MSKPLYSRTPLFRSHQLLKKAGLHVFYKMECYQPSGSFKIRGIEKLCRHFMEHGKTSFIIPSGGNAGYSLAFAGKQLGAAVKVIVPESTSSVLIEKIRTLDAEVEVHGKVWDDANGYAQTLVAEGGYTFIHPFDHPLLWQGHSSIIDECAELMPEPDKLVVAVGGGGLLSGIFEGMKRNGWNKATVVTAETEGAASFLKSWTEKKVIALDEIKTIAGSLAAKKVCLNAIEMANNFNVSPFIVSDAGAIKACGNFLNEYNVLVEPACGAALAYPYYAAEQANADEQVLIIACGGICMDIGQFLDYSEK